jgi:hypothetical protein
MNILTRDATQSSAELAKSFAATAPDFSSIECLANTTPSSMLTAMDILIAVPESSSPSTLRSVLAALRAQKLEVTHDHKNWGDWIRIDGCETVISIEVAHGLTSSATIEFCEDDSEDILPAIYRAFDHIGWIGMDEDGEYQLV